MDRSMSPFSCNSPSSIIVFSIMNFTFYTYRLAWYLFRFSSLSLYSSSSLWSLMIQG